ncbi:hypothetical protein KCP71_23150 [Salmonella enterica subsp. enterica]|nr:hypothetical protein KCP71_23150 [Salmonella enterica subsp. enterica]
MLIAMSLLSEWRFTGEIVSFLLSARVLGVTAFRLALGNAYPYRLFQTSAVCVSLPKSSGCLTVLWVCRWAG